MTLSLKRVASNIQQKSVQRRVFFICGIPGLNAQLFSKKLWFSHYSLISHNIFGREVLKSCVVLAKKKQYNMQFCFELLILLHITQLYKKQKKFAVLDILENLMFSITNSFYEFTHETIECDLSVMIIAYIYHISHHLIISLSYIIYIIIYHIVTEFLN